MDQTPWDPAEFEAAGVNAGWTGGASHGTDGDQLQWQTAQWTASQMSSTSNSGYHPTDGGEWQTGWIAAEMPSASNFPASDPVPLLAPATSFPGYNTTFTSSSGTSSLPTDLAMHAWSDDLAQVANSKFYAQSTACSSSSSLAGAEYPMSDTGSLYHQNADSTSSLSLPTWDEFNSSSGYNTPFSASSDFPDRNSSSSRYSSLDPTNIWSELPVGIVSNGPQLEFADEPPSVPEPTAAVPVSTKLGSKKAKTRKRARRAKPQDIGDDFELEWQRSDTKWVEDKVWSEYVEFPDGLALTQHKTIRRLERVHGTPSELPHPKIPTAFLLSFPKDIVPTGMTADNFFRDMCPHSWGNSTGNREKVDAKISGFFFPGRSATETIQCRRAVPQCQGVWVCESLDPAFLRAERRTLDVDLQHELAEATLHVREQQEETMVGKVLTYLRALDRVHCTAVLADGSACQGTVSDVRPFKQVIAGKAHGLACTNRSSPVLDSGFPHSTHYIQEDITEDLFLAAKRGEQIIEDDDADNECVRVLSLKQASATAKFCAFNHFKNGTAFSAPLVRISCSARISFYVPDENLYDDLSLTMVAYPEPTSFHEHPSALGSKCTRAVREKYKDCVRACGLDATVAQVEIAPSTRELLGGKRPSDYDPSLVNSRLKYRLLREVRSESGSGTDGANVAEEVAAYIARQQGIADAQQRYIHSFRSTEGKRIFIGAHPPLLSRIHHLRTLDFDTSFKPVQGKLQIFEINGFLASHARVITVLRVWMDVHDRGTFEIVWSDIFGLVLSLTGHPLRFKRLHTGGKLLGINSDMEAAPLLAFADAVWKTMSDARRTQIGDAESVLLFVLVICKVHYNRGIDDGLKHLPSSADSESDSDVSGASEDESEDVQPTHTVTRRRLRGLRHFHSQQQIDALEADILASEDRVLIAWWKQKKMHRWLLPGLVAFLSHIDPDDRHLIPASTNIGEGQHRWNNIQTGTAMGIIESMKKYEQLDIEVEADLKQAALTGDLRNMQNNPVDRYAKRNSRNLASIEGAQRKRTKDQNVRLCEITVSELKEDLLTAKADLKTKSSDPEKATATKTVQLLKAELDVAKSKLAQAKAEVNSNSSGRVRPPRASRSSAPTQVQPAAVPPASATPLPPELESSTSAVITAAPPSPVSAPVAAAAAEGADPAVLSHTRRSTRKRTRAESSATPGPALPSSKRQRPPANPLAGWLMEDPDTGEQLTGEVWVERYPEEFAERYPKDHRRYLEYLQFHSTS